MDGIESISSAQSAQVPSQSLQPPNEQIQQPETAGSTSTAAISEKFPNFKLSTKSNYTVQSVNGEDKIIFAQPQRKETNADGSPYVSPSDKLASKYSWTVVSKPSKNTAIAISAAAVPGDTLEKKRITPMV